MACKVAFALVFFALLFGLVASELCTNGHVLRYCAEDQSPTLTFLVRESSEQLSITLTSLVEFDKDGNPKRTINLQGPVALSTVSAKPLTKVFQTYVQNGTFGSNGFYTIQSVFFAEEEQWKVYGKRKSYPAQSVKWIITVANFPFESADSTLTLNFEVSGTYDMNRALPKPSSESVDSLTFSDPDSNVTMILNLEKQYWKTIINDVSGYNPLNLLSRSWLAAQGSITLETTSFEDGWWVIIDPSLTIKVSSSSDYKGKTGTTDYSETKKDNFYVYVTMLAAGIVLIFSGFCLFCVCCTGDAGLKKWQRFREFW